MTNIIYNYFKICLITFGKIGSIISVEENNPTSSAVGTGWYTKRFVFLLVDGTGVSSPFFVSPFCSFIFPFPSFSATYSAKG